MKSRISFCNPTALRKDITRFAPVWVLYSVFLLLCNLAIANEPFYLARDMGTFSQAVTIAQCGYAFLTAQVLFGDLYSSRMCNSLHALPLRRETWFFTHVLSGLLFALVPNLGISILLAIQLSELWITAVYFFLMTAMGYLFFFGLAVLCVMCVGSRFAMTVVYAIANLLSILAYWLISTVYLPILRGVEMDFELFRLTCPVVAFGSEEMIDCVLPAGWRYGADLSRIRILFHWEYSAVCAALGIAMGALGLALYRRRHLESAGDFIVVRPIAPVFLVLYTLAVGAVLQAFGDLFDSLEWIFLGTGVAVGYFTGLMLLKRKVRVFSKKAFAGFAVLVGTLALSLAVTVWDPAGITTWVPEREQVKAVCIHPQYFHNTSRCDMDDPVVIESVIAAHQEIVKNEKAGGGVCCRLTICYTLVDGRQVTRQYEIPERTKAAELVKDVFSSPECLFGKYLGTAEEMAKQIVSINLGNGSLLQGPELVPFMEAVLLDAQEGHISAASFFGGWSDYLYIQTRDSELEIFVGENAVHTRRWLEEHPSDDMGIK